MQKPKAVPKRMCIVCREFREKGELIRVVRLKDGSYTFNPKASGRGAYICKNDACITLALKKKHLNRAFKENISEDVYTALSEEYAKYKQN